MTLVLNCTAILLSNKFKYLNMECFVSLINNHKQVGINFYSNFCTVSILSCIIKFSFA